MLNVTKFNNFVKKKQKPPNMFDYTKNETFVKQKNRIDLFFMKIKKSKES